MPGVSYVGNDPTELPSITGKDSQSLHVVNGQMAWSGFKLNPSVISDDTTIFSGSNAILAGPVAIGDATITVEDGATLIVI